MLSGAAFYVFVPALLFRTSARIEFERLDARVLLAFFVPTLVVLGGVYLVLRMHRSGASGEPAAPSVRAEASASSNRSRG